MLDELRKISPDIIEAVLISRGDKKTGLPPRMVEYIIQIDRAFSLFKENSRNQLKAAMALNKEFPTVSLRTCRYRVSDAVNYMYQDNDISRQAWLNLYADHFDRLAELNELQHDFKAALKCREKALLYRLESAKDEVDPSYITRKEIIVSPDVQLDRMGITPMNMQDAYQKALTLIHKEELPNTDKLRVINELRSELDIEDTDSE